MCSASFPRSSPLADASLPSTGSSGASSPASTVLSKRYDFLPPLPPHFVAFAWRYLGCTRAVCSSGGRVRRQRPGVGHPVAPAGMYRGNDRSSQVPGEPRLSVCPCSVDSGGTVRARPLRRDSVALGIRKAKAPTKGLSKLNSMAFGLAVYASQCRLPHTTQDSLPAAGQALPDGLSTRKVPTKGFRLASVHLIPLSQASWRNRIDRGCETTSVGRTAAPRARPKRYHYSNW
jgi:hypothetical protein